MSSIHDRGVERRFPARPESAAAARSFVLKAAAGKEGEADSSRLVLLVSELATNAILHAGTPFLVSVNPTDEGVRVAVSDGSPDMPVLRPQTHDQPSGRGMLVVEEMSDRWGLDVAPDGKTVWFEIHWDTDGGQVV